MNNACDYDEPAPGWPACDTCGVECTFSTGKCNCCDACIPDACAWCGAPLDYDDSAGPVRYCDRECWLSDGGQL